MNTRHFIKVIFYLLIILLWFGKPAVPASLEEINIGDILVHLRLYEGSRGNEIQKSSVVSSYYLKPLFVSNMVSKLDIDEEKKELKRIFNLTDIKLMTRTQLGWKFGKHANYFQMMVLNGHEFQVQLTMIGEKNDFKVVVTDTGMKEQEPLLETHVVLPEKKSTVFGFEDSLRKPFFICLQREENQSIIDKEPVQLPPNTSITLLKRVMPLYPVEALKKRIKGDVTLEATIDREGKAVDIHVVNGPPELYLAAVEALKQWRWEPVTINSKVRPVKLTTVINFDLPKDTEENSGVMDFYFENATLSDVLKFIAKQININIIVDPDVDLEARVSCNLKQTPWDQALDWMLQLNGLDMIHKGNVVRILKANPANKDLKQATQEKNYNGEPIQLNFRNAKLIDVLNIIAKIGKLSLDIAPGIQGKVSTRLYEIPWDQALDLILQINGLDKKLEGKVLKIFKREIPQKISPDKASVNIPDILPTSGYLLVPFGYRTTIPGTENEFHNGIDIAAKIGTKVTAPADGVVVACDKFREGYGKLIIIDHNNGYTTYFGELSACQVKKGEQVKRGQVIGLVGNSGSNREPHLHYEVRFQDKPINPMSLIQLK